MLVDIDDVKLAVEDVGWLSRRFIDRINTIDQTHAHSRRSARESQQQEEDDDED